MTTRQENLKQEIYKIADELHFGISNDSSDWFYLFKTRADDTYLINTDSTGMKYRNWVKISMLELSSDFIEEFKNHLYLHLIKNNSVCQSSNR